METRASYVVVGGFVIALMAGVLAFALWLGASDGGERTDPYRVDFRGTVTGLQVGSGVLYRGIPVGEVTELEIDESGRFITAMIEVREDTPIKVDTKAVLEQQLLTGVSLIQLRGGGPESPRLEPVGDEKVARIESVQSTFEEISESAPELIADLGVLLSRAQALLSPKNIQNVSGILGDVRILSENVAANSTEIDQLIKDSAGTMTAVREAMVKFGDLAGEIQDIAQEQRDQLEPTVNQVQRTAAAFSTLAENLDEVVAENRRAFQDFSSTGLYELTRFLTEARALVAALQRLTERIERDPARFFFGDSQRGVQVE